jgi:hypothetical protein
MFAGRIEDHFGEWNPAQLSLFIKQPRDQLIDWRFCLLRKTFRGAQTDGDKNRDAKHCSIQNPHLRMDKSKRTAIQARLPFSK